MRKLWKFNRAGAQGRADIQKYLGSFPELMRREAIEHEAFFRKVVKEQELACPDEVVSDLRFYSVASRTNEDESPPSSHPDVLTRATREAQQSGDVGVILRHAVQVIQTIDGLESGGSARGIIEDVLPEPAFDLQSTATWSSHFGPGRSRVVVDRCVQVLNRITDAPYQWFVLGGALAAATASALIVIGTYWSLVPLVVCIFCDGLDGGVLRRQHATNRAIYLSCLTSHFNDIVLFVGLVTFNYSNETMSHISTILFLGAVGLSFFSSFARAALYQTGIEVPKSWLERGVRLFAVVVAVATRSIWPAMSILTGFAVCEVIYILRAVMVTRVDAIYSFIHLGPSSRGAMPQSSAGEQDRWINQVRDSVGATSSV